MFDKLDEIRSAWEENTPIIIHSPSTTDYYLIVPSQIINRISLEEYIKWGGSIFFGVTHEVMKQLEIPALSTIYQGLASRYPMLYLLSKKQQLEDIPDISISIGPRSKEYASEPEDLAAYLQNLGDLVDNRSGFDISKDEFQQRFASLSTSPGPILLVKGAHSILKARNSITELGIGLADVSNYSPSICFTKIKAHSLELHSTILDDYPIISPKTIINLWRSIKKVSKDKITYL